MVIRFPNIIILTGYPIYFYTIIIYLPPAILLSLTVTEVEVKSKLDRRLAYLLGHGFQYALDGFRVEHGHFGDWFFETGKIEKFAVSRKPDAVEWTRVCEVSARGGRADGCVPRHKGAKQKKKKTTRRYGKIRTTVRTVNGPTK